MTTQNTILSFQNFVYCPCGIGLFQKISIPPTKEINNAPPLRTSYTNLRHSLDNFPSSSDGWVSFLEQPIVMVSGINFECLEITS